MAREISPHDLHALLAGDELQLIDVRRTHEHEAGRIAGDRWIELGDLTEQTDTIDRMRPVVFYCRSGGRSAMATDAFAQAGYDAQNLTGGLLAWKAAGLSLTPEDGEVAEP